MRGCLAVLAWVALLLPWERCHAACHDRVEVGPHECHPGEHGPELPEDQSRDEKITFDSVRPSAEPLVAPAAPVVAVTPPVAAAAVVVAAPPVPLPAPPPRSTVLLL
jgi:hypothetical protein